MNWLTRTAKTENPIYGELIAHIAKVVADAEPNENGIKSAYYAIDFADSMLTIIASEKPNSRIKFESALIKEKQTIITTFIVSSEPPHNLQNYYKGILEDGGYLKPIFNSSYLTACFSKGRAEETFRKDVLQPLIEAMNIVPEAALGDVFYHTMFKIQGSKDSLVIKQTKLLDGTDISTKFDIVQQPESNKIHITSTIKSPSGAEQVIKAEVLDSTGRFDHCSTFKVVSYSDSKSGTEFFFAREQKADPAISKKYEDLLTQNVLAHHAKDLGVSLSALSTIACAAR